MPFPPAFTDTWDITSPPDTQLLNQGALDFRNLKLDVMQRFSLLSGIFANRPTPETVNATWGGVGFGLLYFSTDTSQIFQWSGAGPAWVDISASFFVAPSKIPQIVASPAALLAQQANVGSTLLYAVPASGAGRYRPNASIVVTQQATTSCTVPILTIDFTDLDTSLPISDNFLVNHSINIVGTYSPLYTGFTVGFPIMNVKASTNINFRTTGYVSSGVTPMQYSLRVTLEYLGP